MTSGDEAIRPPHPNTQFPILLLASCIKKIPEDFPQTSGIGDSWSGRPSVQTERDN